MADFKQLLAKHGLQAEFAGGGSLVVNSRVIVRKQLGGALEHPSGRSDCLAFRSLVAPRSATSCRMMCSLDWGETAMQVVPWMRMKFSA